MESISVATGWFPTFMAWFRNLSDRDAALALTVLGALMAVIGWALSQLIPLAVRKLWTRRTPIQLLIQFRRESLPAAFPPDGHLRLVDVGRPSVVPDGDGIRELRHPAGSVIRWDGKSEPEPRWMQSTRCEVANLSGTTLVEARLTLRADLYEVVRGSDTGSRSGKHLLRRRIPVHLTNIKPDTPFVFHVTNRDNEVFASIDIDLRARALVAGEQKARRVQIIKQKSALLDRLGMLLPSGLQGTPTTSVLVASQGDGVVVTIDGEATRNTAQRPGGEAPKLPLS